VPELRCLEANDSFLSLAGLRRDQVIGQVNADLPLWPQGGARDVWVDADGTLYNKIGTSLLALAAMDAGVPFMVCAETYKFSNRSGVTVEERSSAEVADPLRPEDLPGVRFYNPVFDDTDPCLIDCIITEKGVISPDMAPSIIKDMLGYLSPEELNWL
jgi:hypothetical protein